MTSVDQNQYIHLTADSKGGYLCHPKPLLQMELALDDHVGGFHSASKHRMTMQNPTAVDLPLPSLPFLNPFPRPFSFGLDLPFVHHSTNPPPLLPDPRFLPLQHLPGDLNSGYSLQDVIPPPQSHRLYMLPREANNAAFNGQYQVHMETLQNHLQDMINSSLPSFKYSLDGGIRKARRKRGHKLNSIPTNNNIRNANDMLLSSATTATVTTTTIALDRTTNIVHNRLPALPKLHALGRRSSTAHPTSSPPYPIRYNLLNPPPLHLPIIESTNLDHHLPSLLSTTEFVDKRYHTRKQPLHLSNSVRDSRRIKSTSDFHAFKDVETDFNEDSIFNAPKLPPSLSIGNKDLASKLNKEMNVALNLSLSLENFKNNLQEEKIVNQSPNDMKRLMDNNITKNGSFNQNSLAYEVMRPQRLNSGVCHQDNITDFECMNPANPFFHGGVGWPMTNTAFSLDLNNRPTGLPHLLQFPSLASHFPTDVDTMRVANMTTSALSENQKKSPAFISPSFSSSADDFDRSNFMMGESRTRRQQSHISLSNSCQSSFFKSMTRLKEVTGELGDLLGDGVRRKDLSECPSHHDQLDLEALLYENVSDISVSSNVNSTVDSQCSINVKQEVDENQQIENLNVTHDVNDEETVNESRRSFDGDISNGKDSSELIQVETVDERDCITRLSSSDETHFILERNSFRGNVSDSVESFQLSLRTISSKDPTRRSNSNATLEMNDLEDEGSLSKETIFGYRCHLCSYNGRSQNCLNKHLNAHGQTCKMCRFCQKAFERPSDLVRHEERHQKRNRLLIDPPDDRPLQSVRFKSGRRLRRHCFWNCRQCNFSCNEAKKLIEHKRTSHPIECNLCRMTFMTESHLENHRSTYHTTSITRLDTYDQSVLTGTRLLTCELTAHQEITLNLDSFLELSLDCSNIPEVSSIRDVHCILGKTDVCLSAYMMSADAKQVPPVDMCILPPVSANAGQVSVITQAQCLLPSTISDVEQLSSVNEGLLPLPSSSSSDVGQDVTIKPTFSTCFKLLSSCLSDEYSSGQSNQMDAFGLNNISSSEMMRNKSSSSVPLVSVDRSTNSGNCTPLTVAAFEKTVTAFEPVDTSLTSTTEKTFKETLKESTFKSQQLFIVGSDVIDPNISISPPVLEIISNASVSNVSGATHSPFAQMKREETELPVLRSLVLKLKIHRDEKSETIQILKDKQEKCRDEKHDMSKRRVKEKCISKLNSTLKESTSTVFVDSFKDKHKVETKALSSSNADTTKTTANSGPVSSKSNGLNVETKSAFVCVRCKYSTNAKFKYQQHLKAHNGRFVCRKCNKACIKSSDLYRHWSTHNVKGPDGHFVCDSCDFMSPQKYALEDHMKQHYSLHPERPHRQTSLMSRCGFCQKNILRSRLFEHKRVVHGRFFEKRRPSDDVIRDANDNPVKRPSKMFVCPQCDRKFTTPSYLLRHHFVSHPRETEMAGDDTLEEPGCRFCSIKIEDVDRLHQHEIQHVLQNCSDSDKNRNLRVCISLTDVVEIISSKRQFNSSIKLSPRSPRKTGLRRRRLKCPHCKRSFKMQYFLDQHLRTHGNERPYVCQACGTGFALVQSLNIHRRLKCPQNRNISSAVNETKLSNNGDVRDGMRPTDAKFSNYKSENRLLYESGKTGDESICFEEIVDVR